MMLNGVPIITSSDLEEPGREVIYYNRYPRMVYIWQYYSVDHTCWLKEITRWPDDIPPGLQSLMSNQILFDWRTDYARNNRRPAIIEAAI